MNGALIEEIVIKSGKHQRSKQRRQDLCWKVHDRAQSFVLRSYTMHDFRNQNVSIGWVISQYNRQQLCFTRCQSQKSIQ